MTSETISHPTGDSVLTLAFERSGHSAAGSPVELVCARLPFVDRLRRDIEAYRRTPTTEEELAVAHLPMRFDLGEDG